MNPPMSESLSKVRLGLPVILVMGVLAVGTFLISGWSESHYSGGPEDAPERLEYVFKSGVEVRDVSDDSSDWNALNDQRVLESGLSFRTDAENELGIFFEGGDLIRLYPNTEVVFDVVDWMETPIALSMALKEGEVWVSNVQGLMNVGVHTDRVGVVPQDASSFVRKVGDKVTIFAAHHSTRVAFLAEGDDPTVLNDYVLTESHQVDVLESTLNPALGELRYTKLVKEYPFVYKELDKWESSWEMALDSDLGRLHDVYAAFLSELRRTGSGGSAADSVWFSLKSGMAKLRSWLTFDENYLIEQEERDDLGILLQALYLIQEDRDIDALERLSRFQESVQDFESVDSFGSMIRVFRAVAWGNEFYPVKVLLRDVQLSAASEDDQFQLALVFLRDRLNEMYDLLDLGERAIAPEALLEYKSEWTHLLASSGVIFRDHVRYLTEERQILQNLLFREDTFYSLASYEALSELEYRILSLTAAEYDLNEERQAFVQDKIRILGKLVPLIEGGVVGVKEGGDLGMYLLEESQSLMSDLTKEVAVSQTFRDRLEELKHQFDFIESPEFRLGEGSFEERLQDFLSKEDDLDALSAYVTGLQETGEREETDTAEASLLEAETALRDAQVNFDFLAPIFRDPQDYRLFRIEGGHVGGIFFEGNYDRLTQLVYDLSVQGEAFSSGVKLRNFKQVVSEAISQDRATLVLPSGADDIDSEERVLLSPVEKVAVELARNDIETLSTLRPESRNITVLSLNDNLFHVTLQLSTKQGRFNVEFDYDMGTHQAFSITAERNDVFLSIEDTSIVQLSEVVTAAVEAQAALALGS